MTSSYFTGLAEQICLHLSKAGKSICVAVCWFSNRNIFEVLKTRLLAGVKVELLIEFDSQNIRENGLDFQAFIDLGGILFAHCDPGLMHHKFAIVDDNLLLTGSFNWTYNSNAENLLVTDEPGIVADFEREFDRQQRAAKRIFTVKNEAVKPFSAFPIFENTNFQKVDLKKKIAGGCSIWIVRSDKMRCDESRLIQEYALPFDPYFVLTNFWNTTRLFDKEIFGKEWSRFSDGLPVVLRRDIKLFACRLKVGDIVLLAGKKKQLKAIGVIQSEPKQYESDLYSSVRYVQWINILPTVYLQKKGFLASVVRFRGSGLRLLQEIFDGNE